MALEIERVHVSQMMENPSVFPISRPIYSRLEAFLDVLGEEAPRAAERGFQWWRIANAEV
jgi:hypothetical protein